jgi:hypothetical protein
MDGSGPDPAGSSPWRGRGGATDGVAYLGGPHGAKDKAQSAHKARKTSQVKHQEGVRHEHRVQIE